MTAPFVRRILALVAAALSAGPLGAQHWQMQYLYDEVKSNLTITDLQVSSASHAVAVGVITEGESRKPVELATTDAGAHWQRTPLREEPFSLFLLNDSVGWLVTEKGVWRTGEAGKIWTKLPKLPREAQALRVYFADENRGWAACTNRTVLETQNGGQHWTPISAASSEPGNPQFSAYSWIAFANAQAGLITGANEPMKRERLPDWLAPDTALGDRETPHLSLTLQTLDGGKTWQSHSTSMFGEITRSRFSPPHFGLGLIEHDQSFQYPSEVFAISWPHGQNKIVYQDKSFFISDVWVTPDGTYYLAGIEIASRLRNIVPQKVKVLVSHDLTTWTPIGVDYRATANRVYLGGTGEDALWLATNNGTIMKLVP